MALLVLVHVDPDHVLLGVEQGGRQRLGQLGLSHPGVTTSPGDVGTREVMDAGSRRAKGVLMFSISTTVDGVFHSDDVEPRMLLVHYLRTRLGRTGTVIGCDTSNCGACTVLLSAATVPVPKKRHVTAPATA
jgi:hypothetical protein